MILNQRKVDNADKVQLIAAMMVANGNPTRMPEGEIARVSVPEIGEFFNVVEIALGLIAEMHRQSEDDWDGVVWFELFEDNTHRSLADALVEFIIDHDPKIDEVRPVVIDWLNSNTL